MGDLLRPIASLIGDAPHECEPTEPASARTIHVDRAQAMRWHGVPEYYVSRLHVDLPDEPGFIAARNLCCSGPLPEIITMQGDNGNGKTHTATRVFAFAFETFWASNGAMPTALWITGHDVMATLKNFERYDVQYELAQFARYQLLMIDDLFTERVTEADAENVASLIDRRKNDRRTTIITTNMTGKEIAERYSRRITDRICEGVVIQFTGGSHRLKDFQERKRASAQGVTA